MLRLVYNKLSSTTPNNYRDIMTKEQLITEYTVNNLTTKDIADKYNIGKTTVKRLLKKYHIPTNNSKRHTKYSSVLTYDFLMLHYVQLGKSYIEIANELKLRPDTIGRAINRLNIPKRDTGTRLGKKTKRLQTPQNDLSSKIFGDLEVIKYVLGGWLCKCKCGQNKIYSTRRLTHDGVMSCGCRHKIKGSNHHFWKGYGDIPMSVYSHYYHHAVDRDIIFDVSIEYIWELFELQQGLCAISKLPISFDKTNKTASLDRIDSALGYIEGNVQWLHKHVNQMKWNFQQEYFISLCKQIAFLH